MAPRRHRIKSAVQTPREKARRVPPHHAHGCVGCGRRYTDQCRTPLENGRCQTCRAGHPPPAWDLNHAPASCCSTKSRLLTDVDEMFRYGLGGPGPWYQCRECFRTHPFDPKEKSQ